MNSSGSATEITERSVNDLRPPERSVRTHNRAQERKLTRIIRKHGIVAPIIVDPNGYIINGVLVWKCCKKLGFDSVPTVVVRTNDAAAVKALRLALNRVAEDAGWDKKNLREELKYLLEVDYELDLTGFDAPEIGAILEIETPTIGVVDLDEEDCRPVQQSRRRATSSPATVTGSPAGMPGTLLYWRAFEAKTPSGW
jgi:ParB-like chromosome segregation protein Spo0J